MKEVLFQTKKIWHKSLWQSRNRHGTRRIQTHLKLKHHESKKIWHKSLWQSRNRHGTRRIQTHL